jgi:membrane protein
MVVAKAAEEPAPPGRPEKRPRLDDAPAVQPAPASPLAPLTPISRRLARFFGLTLRQAHEDGIFLTASALAFVTILSLIPLLAAFSFVGARVFNRYQQRSLEVFVQVLPYSDQTVTEKLREFLEQAGTIHGYSIVFFFLTTLFAFATIEESLNKIWNVSRRRPVKVRLLSFLLLLFWGPLLIGATFTSLILLRQSPGLRVILQSSILFAVLPFVATAIGLTTLYWIVPYTRVQVRSALVGGLLAAILLELLRQGFGSWVNFFRNVNIVYGSFAFALLFMISIELTWTIVLLGAEAAYTAQHFPRLIRGIHYEPPLQAAWVGLSALTLIARRFDRGEPPLSPTALAERLHLSPRELERVIRPLLTHRLLRESTGERGYLLAVDPQQLPVDRVFQAYDHRARRGVEPVGPELRGRLESLIGDLAQARGEHLGGATLAELIAE